MTDDDFRPGRIWSLPAWKKKAVPVELNGHPRNGVGDPHIPPPNPARSRRGGMARAKQLKEARRKKFDDNTVIFREGI